MRKKTLNYNINVAAEEQRLHFWQDDVMQSLDIISRA